MPPTKTQKKTSRKHPTGRRTTKPAMTRQEQLEAILKIHRPEIVSMAKGTLDVWYRDVKLLG